MSTDVTGVYTFHNGPTTIQETTANVNIIELEDNELLSLINSCEFEGTTVKVIEIVRHVCQLITNETIGSLFALQKGTKLIATVVNLGHDESFPDKSALLRGIIIYHGSGQHELVHLTHTGDEFVGSN